MEYLTNKFYNKKGERLSIAATKIDNKLNINIIRCSKKDSFSKKFARHAQYLIENSDHVTIYGNDLHPERLSIDITQDKPKASFLRWCNENFYKKTIVYKEVEVLANVNKREIL